MGRVLGRSNRGQGGVFAASGEASQRLSGEGEPPRELFEFADKWGLSLSLSRDSSLDELWDQLSQYLWGVRKEFQLPLQLLGTDFQKSVWQVLMTIPWGTTVTYGELAASLGNRGLARAVGGPTVLIQCRLSYPATEWLQPAV